MESEYKVGEHRYISREYTAGVHVVFVDPHGIRRDALVTVWWAQGETRSKWMETYQGSEAGCNLVWVTGDEKRTDQYGRQTVHDTSVVHKGSQSAPGNYWVWPDE